MLVEKQERAWIVKPVTSRERPKGTIPSYSQKALRRETCYGVWLAMSGRVKASSQTTRKNHSE